MAALWMVIFGWTSAAAAQPRPIDTSKSVVTVQVKKAGILSAFGHDHEIAAPIASGMVDTGGRKVELRFNAAGLQVRDQGISEKDRAEIQRTMLGSEVLDAQRFPEIVFRSTAAEAAGAGAWNLRGDLTAHGRTRPVMVQVRDNGDHFVGALRLRQTEFGIRPIKVAGGTVQVKDEIRIDFDIRPAR